MRKMLLVSEVAGLARDIERSSFDMDVSIPVDSEALGSNKETLHGLNFADDDADDNTVMSPRSRRSEHTAEKVIDTDAVDPLTGSLNTSEKIKLTQLLERWEEPNRSRNAVRTSCTGRGVTSNFPAATV